MRSKQILDAIEKVMRVGRAPTYVFMNPNDARALGIQVDEVRPVLDGYGTLRADEFGRWSMPRMPVFE